MKKYNWYNLASIIFLFTISSCLTTYNNTDLFKNEESEYLFDAALEFELKGQLDSALIYFNKADKSAPNTAIIIHERGLLKSSMRQHNAALIDLDKSIELTTDTDLIELRVSNRALIYLQMGNIDKACEDWNRFRETSKNYIDKYCK